MFIEIETESSEREKKTFSFGTGNFVMSGNYRRKHKLDD